jgi:hypothetical protein
LRIDPEPGHEPTVPLPGDAYDVSVSSRRNDPVAPWGHSQ